MFSIISKCLYNSTMLEELVFLISLIKCIVNCARSYRWCRLRALYLNSALVWRNARALYNDILYNELVLTNHGARISLNISWDIMHAAYIISMSARNSWYISRNKKACSSGIIELYKHLGIFKNTPHFFLKIPSRL